MRYKMVKSRNGVANSKGRYVAKVCHDQVVDFDAFANRIEACTTLTTADIRAALSAFGTELCNCLRNGDTVKLPDIGTFKLEMECTPVDNPDDFRPQDHLRRFQLHVIPESKKGEQPLYSGIKLEKAKV